MVARDGPARLAPWRRCRAGTGRRRRTDAMNNSRAANGPAAAVDMARDSSGSSKAESRSQDTHRPIIGRAAVGGAAEGVRTTMAYYRVVGEIPHKRHTQFRKPDGGLYAEELMGVEGFSSDSSLLYHERIPTAIVASEVFDAPDSLAPANHPLKPRHFKTHKLNGEDADADPRPAAADGEQRRAAVVLGGRAARRRCTATPSATSVVYVESGTARFESVFGAIDVGQGDYVVIPTSTTHRWVPTGRPAAADAGDRGVGPHRPAPALPVDQGPVPRALAVLRARSARPGRAARRRWRRGRPDIEVLVQHRHGLDAVTPTPTTRSTSSAGTAASTRTRSTSPTSSRSPGASTSRRRCTRRSRARTS